MAGSCGALLLSLLLLLHSPGACGAPPQPRGEWGAGAGGLGGLGVLLLPLGTGREEGMPREVKELCPGCPRAAGPGAGLAPVGTAQVAAGHSWGWRRPRWDQGSAFPALSNSTGAAWAGSCSRNWLNTPGSPPEQGWVGLLGARFSLDFLHLFQSKILLCLAGGQ